MKVSIRPSKQNITFWFNGIMFEILSIFKIIWTECYIGQRTFVKEKKLIFGKQLELSFIDAGNNSRLMVKLPDRW